MNPFTSLSTNIKENEPLKNHATFQIGGPARFYAELTEAEELKQVLQIAQENKLNYTFIGGGSNLLVSDQGYDGLIIKLKSGLLEFQDNQVTVNSGYSLAGLIMASLDQGLIGLEFEAGVPGTIGGAIRGNAGTYGEAMDKVVSEVQFLDDDLNIKTITGAECNFSYRHSIFKENEKWVIISAKLKLNKGDVSEARNLIEERIAYRQNTQPYEHPNAGCVFKNVIYSDEVVKKMEFLGWQLSPKFKEYEKIPTAWIIEQLGLKGKKIGQAEVSEKHANYIVNLGGATADEVVQLISYIKQQVRDKVGLQLTEEVRYLGFQ